MARNKGGLGPNWKGFDSYLTEEFTESVSTALEPFVPKRQTAGSADYSFAIENEKKVQEALAAGEDPGPGYFATQYPSSTRVFSYRYVPHDPNDSTDAGLGTLYVQFHKRDDRYQYDNVEHGTFAAFATDGVSKGKFINSTLNHYTYRKIVGKEDRSQIFFGT